MTVEKKTTKALLLRQFEEMRNELHSHVVAKLSNVHDAEDVVQEVYIRLARLDEDHQLENTNLRGYIYTIASNLSINVLRKRTYTGGIYNDEAEVEDASSNLTEPALLLEQQQKAEMLRAAIASLPPKCREVFLLYKFRNLSQKQISYAAQDTEYLFEIKDKLTKMLKREKRFDLFLKSMKIVPTLVDMEMSGFKLSTFEH